MTSRSRDRNLGGLCLVGIDRPESQATQRLDFSQLAKFAADVVALNAQENGKVSTPEGHRKEIKAASLASFQTSPIVKMLRSDAETPDVTVLRPTRKE